MISLLRAVTASVLLLLSADSVLGQTTVDLASQRLGPGYMNLFLAYAVAWILVLGWVVSIALRLTKVERRLEASSPRAEAQSSAENP